MRVPLPEVTLEDVSIRAPVKGAIRLPRQVSPDDQFQSAPP